MIDVQAAAERLKPVIVRTPLQFHQRLSEKYGCKVFLKREDQQPVRSYKLRGAFNKIISLDKNSLQRGVVCASAGNHAQGVAFSCKRLEIAGFIFMPANTPEQKLKRVKMLGEEYIKIFLTGESYDEAANEAKQFCETTGRTLIPPFDDEKVIEGQATVGIEILEDLENVDYIFIPVGGGGLAAGIGTVASSKNLIGVEPAGAASLTAAFDEGRPVTLEKIDPFIDGAAVRRVGDITYAICQKTLKDIITVPEGKVCSTLLSLYNEDGIVVEPAGALSVAALDEYAEKIKGKNVVCILSGGNNDSNRMEEIKKLAEEWEGWQHYLIIRFHHYPDGLKEFFTSLLGQDDYVNRIEYIRRDHGRSTFALVGIRSRGFEVLQNRLSSQHVEFRKVKREDFIFKYWV